jgi:enterochelin esterase-like enzyme
MKIKVYLPPGYEDGEDFPVLYFFADYGGGAYTVMEQYGAAYTAEKMIEENKIEPLIIVAVGLDRSFGLNSSEQVQIVETTSGKVFHTGMYEDYFMLEIIPYIDNNYNTLQDKNSRYVGGYSMGGFAALHLALKYPEYFSKSGGHSPSIFIDEFPDKTVTDFLYPSEEIRDYRDPIRIVQNSQEEFPAFYLDVEMGGSSGVEYLYNEMIKKGIKAEYHVMGLSHSRETCNSNMEDYLMFYAGISEE